MNKKCARCLKTVYPVEELKCLDKIWHKSCFRCTECGMALTLKNYKGFNRMPYCSAHTPKVQATPIASTPELKRLTNNTRIQSNIKYHEDYERGKGRCHQTSDDTETVRNKQNTKMYSNVAYRVCKYEHKNIVEQRKRELGDILRKNSSGRSGLDEASSSPAPVPVPLRSSISNQQKPKTSTRKPLPSSASGHSNYSNYTASSISSSKTTNLAYKSSKFIRKLSSTSNGFGSSLSSMDSSRSMPLEEAIKTSRLDAGNTPQNVEEIFLRQAFDSESLSRSSVGSVLTAHDTKSEMTNDLHKSIELINSSNVTLTESFKRMLPLTASKWNQDETFENATKYIQPDPIMEFPLEASTEDSEEPATSSRNASIVERKSSKTNLHIYCAVYDFEAQESDEVSFLEGDHIIEVEPETSGWLTGRVERTGKIGLVPANYVKGLDSDTITKTNEKLPQSENEKVIDAIQNNIDQLSPSN